MKIKRIIPRLYYFFSILFFLRRVDNKLTVISNIKRLLYGKAKIIISLDNTWRFRTRDMYDILAIKEIFDDNIYLPLFNNLKKNTTLIDIGSYIGDVIIYAQKFKEIKHIIAVEPLTDNMKILKENVGLNKINNLSVIQAAVSPRKGVSYIYIHPNKGQSGFYQYTDNLRQIRVKTVTLKEIMELLPTANIILKCDCEGAEYEIFLNAKPKLLSDIDRIIFEYHDEKRLPVIINHLKKAGFRVRVWKHPVEPNLGTAFAY